MRKVYKLEDLDCANCAAKMQAAIAKIDGVNEVSVNYMTQKLTLDADDARFEVILKLAQKAMNKVEPDCRIIK